MSIHPYKMNGGVSPYMDSRTGKPSSGTFLNKQILAVYHGFYYAGDQEKRERTGTIENIITTLKNQFGNTCRPTLDQACENLKQILSKDLPEILEKTGKKELMVCVVPRSKAENTYSSSQLLFKKTIKDCITNLNGFLDGTECIVRYTDTRTTHMDKSGYGGNGDLPYPGITKNTCRISNVMGKEILLIDDLYTEGVNIDEDAIQALLENGAQSVIFYSLGKTMKRSV